MDPIWNRMLRLPLHAQTVRIPAQAASQLSSVASEQLVREWDELAVRMRASPYLRPGWVQAWWRAFGKGDLEIKTLRRNGRLAALLPVANDRGVLRSASNHHSPRTELLAEDMPAALELAMSLYEGHPRRVAISPLDHAGSSIRACQWAAEAAGYKSVARPYRYSPYLDIAGEWVDYESKLSRNLLTNLRRARARLARQGRLEVEIEIGRASCRVRV